MERQKQQKYLLDIWDACSDFEILVGLMWSISYLKSFEVDIAFKASLCKLTNFFDILIFSRYLFFEILIFSRYLFFDILVLRDTYFCDILVFRDIYFVEILLSSSIRGSRQTPRNLSHTSQRWLIIRDWLIG